MKLSNFDWTDKDSVKWFILLPTGHEGPYSLGQLEQFLAAGKITPEVKIWCEGMPESVPFSKSFTEKKELPPTPKDEIPDLPPVPEEETPPPFIAEELPPIPEVEETEQPAKTRKLWPFVVGVGVVMAGIVFAGMIKNFEEVSIRRYPKMTMELHEKISKELAFEGWNKPIFFKEYLPSDHSHIWLVTSSFETCKVEATFQSLPGKLLALDDEKVAFKSSGVLTDHVVEFSSFDFSAGTKIVPGMYEMDVKASDCSWEGFLPKLMNKFVPPASNYVARTKVVLFSKGAEEYGRILDKLIKQKTQKERVAQNREELFWQDLQQKLQTLEAISLQIEQHFLDFLDSKKFKANLKPMVDSYTKKFGSFLTNFVVENEKYFKTVDLSQMKGGANRRNYEVMVRLTSKRIGFESMKFIEEFQAKKGNPTEKQLEDYSNRIRKAFSAIKNDITQKILQISEDRSH
ncbi:DUF4339 domain-containing protein [Peredibacter sp. HCB2-198]|uniref:DUF4339 domain-containing protein n=1 Tax=Peredibacter sp. HCB2-198 TaxID=3383025 RepID=UPI0038B5152B